MGRILGVILGIICTVSFAQEKALHEYVNPFIGTGGHGHTYPGVSAPFGMMQLSPDSRLDGWDGCGGYHYSDSIIYGFSHTHLSGTGVSDYGDLLIMPFTGDISWENGSEDPNTGYASYFSHANEKANAGSYSVFLEDDKINVELTTSLRCGMHQYTFPKWETKKVIIDLEHRDMLLDSDLILLNDSTLIGKRISKAWATEQHLYFTVQFSEAAQKSAFRKNEDGKPSKLILEFGHVNPVLTVKVGISAVDMNGAKNNLKTEMPGWDLATYRKECQTLWDTELHKIEAHTNSDFIKTTFYTALYHSYLNPNTFSDVDGRYRGMDMKVHKAKGHTQYTVFSLWDTFRGTHPLFTITQQARTKDFIKTFLAQYKQGGKLPIWELSGNYTGCMIGYHSIPVIVDAYVKGIRDFDAELALKAMRHSAEQFHLGLEAYRKQGYISSEDESESVSKTLEYAYDDWCIAVFADSLGKDSVADYYYKRAQYYKNIFNSESQFMQPRYNGGWKTGFKPDEVTFDYTEANSWQYSLFVPQDTDGLIELLGGRDSLESWLDRLFTVSSETSGRDQVDITGLIGQYAHGNEPSHHMAYLYNFTKNPWKSQEKVGQIMHSLYSSNPDGLSGNEDCGQMSSWYVLSSMGFYSFAPGSDVYLTGTPMLDSAALNLENGNTFKMKRINFIAGNVYVKAIFLNGKKLDRNFIHHHEIMQGGEIIFEMGSKPGEFNGQYPSSKIDKSPLLASPVFVDAIPSFEKKTRIKVASNTAKPVVIRYTTDGSKPTVKSKLYKKPIKLKKSTVVNIRSFADGQSSFPVSADFKKINTNWNIQLESTYANQYSAGGDRALIDQLYGGNDFRTGAWQGYFDTDLVVTLDFKKKQKINRIDMRFMQDIRSWVWFPSEVTFMISDDGENWYAIHTAKNETPIDQYGAIVQKFGFEKAISTQYLKVTAKNRGICPDWHLGAGNPTWIFADEIIIE
ncbi:MAG: glycoside hydrolase family 92 protein [Crocinitomix sp.]|nr:glycoside hydrolase family 92 protein [Crocinitomix sp.]